MQYKVQSYSSQVQIISWWIFYSNDVKFTFIRILTFEALNYATMHRTLGLSTLILVLAGENSSFSEDT